MPTDLYEILWIFLIYGFIGWCLEVSYAAVELGKFVNRGFLNGPICPIYGFGMLAVVEVLWPLRKNVILLFLGAAILTTILEFVAGYVLEKFFHEKWWDYKEYPFNIKGYVCLKFSILWGLAASFAVGAVHPFIFLVITKVPSTVGYIILIILLAMFTADFVITLVELLKLPKQLKAIMELEKVLKNVSDSIGENISDTTLNAKQKGNTLLEENKPKIDELKAEYEKKREEYKKLIENKSFVHKRIVVAFPNLKKGKYKALFEKIPNLKNIKFERKSNEKN